MKKCGLLISAVLCSNLFAGSLTVESGWNLLSISEPTSTAECILEQLPSGSILYKYDNTHKNWLVKSNSYAINTSFSQKGYGFADKITSTEGFWVYNPSDRKVINQSCTHGGGADENNVSSVIDSTPATELTVEQKRALAYMWNEEKLAKDIYFALNDLFPHQTLYNIASKSETEHQSMVEKLLEKYDLNISADDFTGDYDAASLSTVEPGKFLDSDVQNLYDTLYGIGSGSLTDALKVGCMVEVTDINDLNVRLEASQDHEDIVTVFENLRNGSYNHYWAFDGALKSLGVADGCCSAGAEYCKSEDEYPKNQHGNGMRH